MSRKSLSFLCLPALSLCAGALGAQEPSLVLADGGIQFADGSVLESAAGSYQNVLVVAKSSGHYSSIQAALDAIGAELPPASSSSRYLIWVGPGEYEEHVEMKQWVDVQGSGEGLTKIRDVGSSDWFTGTVVVADHAELRFLTVENTGAASYATAIFNEGDHSKLTHVTAIASGESINNAVTSYYVSDAVFADVTAMASGGDSNFGVYNYASSPAMTSSTISASGSGSSDSFGIYNYDSSPKMRSLTASGAGGNLAIGVYNQGTSSPTIHASILRGETAAILTQDAASAEVAHSILDGGRADDSGTYICFSVCDESLNALERDCLPPYQ